MYTIAAKQARSGMARRRPPYGGRGGAGSKGATSALARPAPGRQQVSSWRGIMPDQPKGTKRRLRPECRPGQWPIMGSAMPL
jgi:hypothetical protein